MEAVKELKEFENLIASTMGFRFSKTSTKELGKKLSRVTKTFGFESPEKCVKFLTKKKLTKKQISTLAKDLTIGETYFFRHSPTFQILEKEILPALISQARKKDCTLKIWSAGCSTGEEPYSIAILLDRLIPDIDQWNIKLLATDINPEALDKAKRGLYKNWSFRGAPKKIIKQYFSQEDEKFWKLSNRIKRHVHFDFCNLIMDSDPDTYYQRTHFDLIMCSNVLIYFSEDHIRQVVDNLTRGLKTKGWLIVSPVEAPYVKNDVLASVIIDNIMLFQKVEPKKRVKVVEKKCRQKPFIFPQQENNKPLDRRLDRKMFLGRLYELYHQRELSKVIDALEPILQEINWDKEDIEKLEEEIILYIKVLTNTGKHLKGQDFIEKVLSKYKVSYMLYFLHGVIEQELEHLDEAIISFKRSLFLNPHFAIAHFYLGTLMLLQNDRKEAERYFKNACKWVHSYSSSDIIPGTDDLTKDKLCSAVQHLIKGNV